ncbi:MAG: phosphate signaling complex protein PhoU [Alphaproteobacteria bacterium]|nr:phosphate signaling complex protein PhoU [Alphaproteobacteria bacterium]
MVEHTVKSYEEELKRLHNIIVQMGGLAESQLDAAIRAIVRRDPALAASIIRDDKKVDDLDHEVDTLTTKLLALRQPMAGDLRAIIGAIKISVDLERIADYAANIARRAITLTQASPVKPVYAIPRMARLVQHMIKDVLDAFIARDLDRALSVWHADEEVDEMYTSLFRELLTYMIEDPRSITSCTHLLFVAKNLERIGDHTTNVAETIHFMVSGKRLLVTRPRGQKPEAEYDMSGIGDEGND